MRKHVTYVCLLMVPVFLLVSFITSFCPVSQIHLLSLLGILFFPLALLNVLLLIYFLLRQRKKSIPFGFVFLVTSGMLLNYISISVGGDEEEENISLVSYNSAFFGKWGTPISEKQYYDFISPMKANLYALQEMPYSPILNKDVFTPFVKNKYTVQKGAQNMTLVSQGKVITKGNVKEDRNFGVYSDVVLEGDTLRIYSVHLKPNSISGLIKKPFQNFQSIIEMMYHSVSNREEEVSLLVRHAEASPFPVVIAGDFNSVPCSYVYRQMRNFQDANSVSKQIYAPTYRNKWLPGLRIDYVFTSEEVELCNYEVIKKGTSDHFPVRVALRIP